MPLFAAVDNTNRTPDFENETKTPFNHGRKRMGTN